MALVNTKEMFKNAYDRGDKFKTAVHEMVD